MSLHRYGRAALRQDALRSLAGLVLTGGPLTAAPATPVAVALLGGGFALFALYGLRTARRAVMRIDMGENGIVMSGWGGGHLTWAGLAGMKLRYYTTRRGDARPTERSVGWMQLGLRGEGARMRLDSTLDGFGAIVARAADAARAAGIALDPTTRANLSALGIRDESEPGATTERRVQ